MKICPRVIAFSSAITSTNMENAEMFVFENMAYDISVFYFYMGFSHE